MHTNRAEASSILPASALMPSTHLIQLKIRPTDLPPILSSIFPLTFAFICCGCKFTNFYLFKPLIMYLKCCIFDTYRTCKTGITLKLFIELIYLVWWTVPSFL